MAKKRTTIQSILALILAVSMLSQSFTASVAQTPKMQPLLTQIALETPQQIVSVIVQKHGNSDIPEQLVRQLGGHVTRSLEIINAFVAEIAADSLHELSQDRSVQWVSLDAPVLKSAGGSVNLREDFSSDFSGLGDWSGKPWQEIGESDGHASGDVAITAFLGGELQGTRLQRANKGIQGFANLVDADQATLNIAYRRKNFNSANDFVTVEASNDGGATWALVGRLSGPATDPAIELASWDLTPYAGEQFSFRFVTSESFGDTGKFYLDFLQLDYTPKAERSVDTTQLNRHLFLPLISSHSANQQASSAGAEQNAGAEQLVDPSTVDAINMVADYFDTASFANNQGTHSWGGNWIESDALGLGVDVGHIRVASNALRMDNYPVTTGEPSAARAVSMNNTSVAQLSFSFWTESGVDASDAAVVEVSRDGGTSYTTLETFTGIVGVSSGRRTYDITRFATSNFRVRFRISAGYTSASEYFYADNVQIAYEQIGVSANWVSIVPAGATWRYLDSGIDQGTAWRAPLFNDSTWKEGQAQLGYGQFDESTTVNFGSATNKYVTTYFRRTFYVTDASNFTSLSLILNYDDGAVVYLNGQEVTRANLPTGTIAYTTRASSEMTTWGNSFTIPTAALVTGENVLAVEIHQATASGADLSFDLRLDGWTNCADCIATTNLSNQGLRSIRADSLWNGSSRIQGQGITVAVVDSGIAPHNDTASVLPYGRVLAHVNFVSTQSQVDDLNGHGSHIAGIIAGSGAKSYGAYMGVAPKANLIDVRVTNDLGQGTTADVVAGLQWVLNNKSIYNIRAVNMSLNSAVAESYHTSPLDAAAEILWFNGIVVVVSAGNNGTGSSGVVYPPANDPFVITVGAVDDKGTVSITDDVVPSFSAYGTTTDNFAKPDLVAPGKNIISMLASDDSNLAANHPANAVSGASGLYYFRMSGTSMASAVATGAVALLLQDEPSLTPDQVKFRLKNTANKSWTGYTAAKAGAGYLDIYAAVTGTSTSNANTGIAASQLLWTGSTPVVWGSVNWNSVNWNSVNWNSVNWNSVNWNSVNWNSDYWGE